MDTDMHVLVCMCVCTVSARGGAAGHSKPNISGKLSGRNLFNIFQPQLVRSAAPTLHATTSPNKCESTQVQSWGTKAKEATFLYSQSEPEIFGTTDT